MKRTHLGVALALALGLPLESSGGPFGLDARRHGQSAPRPPPPSEVEPADISPGLPAILEKMRNQEHLTYIEFLVYISALERHPDNVAWIEAQQEATRGARFPARGWAMISSQIHNHHYEGDRNLTLDVVGLDVVDLFLDGTENQGWEEIHTFGTSPKFILGPQGEKIDISHAYAGVAALVMRWNPVTTEVMAHANTGWGDSVQVLVHTVGGAKDAAIGWVTCNFDSCDEGLERLKKARDFKPPDQKAGNRIGVLAHEYLQDHRDATLTAAFRNAIVEYWNEIEEDE